jgi:cation/acetate symporter
MSVKLWTLVFVGASFLLYLAIAWWARVRDTRGFYVAGRGVPAAANGMATAADWMSAASFLSMAGMISTMGYAGGVYLMGWTGGFVLLALVLAPYLRKFGHYTVPDFVGDRYDSQAARLVAVFCALFVSFVYVAGQMRGVGVVFSRFLEVDISAGVVIGMAIVFLYATLGGMKGITWTQVAQYWVLITAFLVPALAISFKLTGQPLPQLGLGGQLRPELAGGGGAALLERLNATLEELGFASYTAAFVGAWDKWNVFLVAASLMVGTAGLPHVIVRFYTVKTVQAARWSGFWALVFIALLYVTAPATAAFARYFLLTTLNERTADELPQWFKNWERTGLILWLDDGDGVVRFSNREDNEIFRSGKLNAAELAGIRVEHQRWVDTGGVAGADGRAALRARSLSGPDNDIIVLATPEMAELSGWIVAFVAAGGLAAALSTASGLLLVISSSVAHDLYFRVFRPQASEKQCLLVGRSAIGVAVVVAGILGIFPPAFVSEVVAFAFSLAAASFFPAIVLGIFNKRVGTVPAVAGMVVGILFSAGYIVWCSFLKMPAQTFGVFPSGVNPQGIGVIGMALNFVVTLGLTPFFPPPREGVQRMVDAVREPEDASEPVEIESAPEH